MDIAEFARGVQAVHTRHGNVENDEIGAYFGGTLDCIETIRGFAADFKARSFQQGADSGANGGIIVNDEDAVWHANPRNRGVTAKSLGSTRLRTSAYQTSGCSTRCFSERPPGLSRVVAAIHFFRCCHSIFKTPRESSASFIAVRSSSETWPSSHCRARMASSTAFTRSSSSIGSVSRTAALYSARQSFSTIGPSCRAIF